MRKLLIILLIAISFQGYSQSCDTCQNNNFTYLWLRKQCFGNYITTKQIFPSLNGTWDIGSSSLKFKRVYANRIISDTVSTPLSDSVWKVFGNSNITAGMFFGTTNAVSIYFRTNGLNRAKIDSSGITEIYDSTKLMYLNAGSIPFIQSTKSIGQNNSALFWDAANARFGLGLNSSLAARLHVVGTGTTSATYGVQIHNSTGTNNAFLVRDDGVSAFRTTAFASGYTVNVGGTNGINVSLAGDGTPLIVSQGFGAQTASNFVSFGPFNPSAGTSLDFNRITGSGQDLSSATTGEFNFFAIRNGRNNGLAQPTFTGTANYLKIGSGSGDGTWSNSSTGTMTGVVIDPIINQSGTGIFRGVYVNPTITAAADFRAFANTVGRNYFNSTSGSTFIGLPSAATVPTTKFHVQGDASLVITTLGNGYDSSLSKSGTTITARPHNHYVHDTTITTSAGTLSIIGASTSPSTEVKLVFTGTTTTWTLPTLANGNGIKYIIKNRGSGAITLNTNAGGNDIYTTAATNTITINAGEMRIIFGDGTFFNSSGAF